MLEVKSLVKEHVDEHGRRLRVVREASFSVEKGRLFTLLGPSGCGKTTTLRCIAGLERPDGGEISFAGRPVYSASRNIFVPASERGVGMVFQSYAIWPHMTVFGNAAFPLQVTGRRSRREIAERVQRVLHIVALDGLEGRRATQLSGGQQQRLALARALVAEPQLLLLDEPLSNLDAKLRERMRLELKRVQRETGLTMIYVTHDQSEALALSDTVAVMNDGAILQLGTPHEIYRRPAGRFVADFVGTTNFIEGIAEGRDRVLTAFGSLGASTDHEMASGAPVVVSIRPEHVQLHCSAAAGAWKANVVGQEFLGDRCDLELRIGEVRLVARGDADAVYAENAEIYVAFPAQHCLVLPKDPTPAGSPRP
jgi:iron(III) transport system ATP-binding protein